MEVTSVHMESSDLGCVAQTFLEADVIFFNTEKQGQDVYSSCW